MKERKIYSVEIIASILISEITFKSDLVNGNKNAPIEYAHWSLCSISPNVVIDFLLLSFTLSVSRSYMLNGERYKIFALIMSYHLANYTHPIHKMRAAICWAGVV